MAQFSLQQALKEDLAEQEIIFIIILTAAFIVNQALSKIFYVNSAEMFPIALKSLDLLPKAYFSSVNQLEYYFSGRPSLTISSKSTP